MRNVKTVSHPENATVHKLLDARSHKGCIVAGSSPVLTTKMKTSRNMEYVKTSFLSENDKLIGLSLGIYKIIVRYHNWNSGCLPQEAKYRFDSCPDYDEQHGGFVLK